MVSCDSLWHHGGYNTEFLLGFVLQLRGLEGVRAIAGDTDGIDGSEDKAGALVTPGTLEGAIDPGRNTVARPGRCSAAE